MFFLFFFGVTSFSMMTTLQRVGHNEEGCFSRSGFAASCLQNPGYPGVSAAMCFLARSSAYLANSSSRLIGGKTCLTSFFATDSDIIFLWSDHLKRSIRSFCLCCLNPLPPFLALQRSREIFVLILLTSALYFSQALRLWIRLQKSSAVLGEFSSDGGGGVWSWKMSVLASSCR